MLAITGSVLALTGDLSFRTAKRVFGQLITAIDEQPAGATMRLDLAGVHKSDSAGLALLLETMAVARSVGKRLAVVNLPESLRTLAQITEVESILQAA